MAPVIRTAAGHCPGSRCRWRPTGPECSPQGTCAAGRSNAAPRPSARDQWRWRSSTGGWRRRAVTEPPAVANPDTAVSSEFTELASDEQVATAAAALERNGIRPLLAATGADARGLVRSLLTDGAEVYNNTSQTLEAIGVADDIERSGRYQPLRLRRIYEYCYPLEDARARRAYGVRSGVNNILIINKVITPGRITAIIVNERLGF